MAKKLPYNKCLLITCSGGGGHLQAAAAKAHELHAHQSHIVVIQRDLLLDWVGKHPGSLFAGFWNLAQKKGKVSIQKMLVWWQSKFDFLFRVPVFIRLFLLILRENIDYIIDTQPLCTSAIVKALRLAQKCQNRTIRYEKIPVDLPTDRATHYFLPIKNLNDKERKIVHLFTTKPLLETHETDEIFWASHTNLPAENIIYGDFPLRPTFKTIDEPLPKHEKLTIAARIPSIETWDCIKDVLSEGKIECDYCPPYLDITIPAHAHLTLLMLGSRPAEKATIKYVKQYIQHKKNHPSELDHILFVFCRKHANTSKSLLGQVCQSILTSSDYPENLTIVPLTFQDDSIIAPLFARADASITRSGGITSMELLSLMDGQIMIHSETKANDSTSLELLLKGIPAWEKGNARYLQAMKNAQIVTPDIFLKAH